MKGDINDEATEIPDIWWAQARKTDMRCLDAALDRFAIECERDKQRRADNLVIAACVAVLLGAALIAWLL